MTGELKDVTRELVEHLQDKGVEDAVDLSLIKRSGENSCKRHFHASAPAAAINALAVLIVDLCNQLQMPAGHVLSVLAAVLMGSAEPKDE